MSQAYNPKTEEVFHIAGDEDHGISANYQLTKSAIGHPQIRYRDIIITADVYLMDGVLSVNLLCPKCRHSLWIKSTNKQMEFKKGANLLSVEPFQCTWEMDDNDPRSAIGANLCRLKLVINNNVAKDA